METLVVYLLPLEGAALLLVRAPGSDMSEPEPEVELSCGRADSDVKFTHQHKRPKCVILS